MKPPLSSIPMNQISDLISTDDPKQLKKAIFLLLVKVDKVITTLMFVVEEQKKQSKKATELEEEIALIREELSEALTAEDHGELVRAISQVESRLESSIQRTREESTGTHQIAELEARLEERERATAIHREEDKERSRVLWTRGLALLGVIGTGLFALIKWLWEAYFQ